MDFAGDPGFAGGGEHVDFAADSEFGEIDAGFDGEAGVGEDEALVVGFKVIQIRTGAVYLIADIVAGTVGEVLGKPCGVDDGTGGVIGLKTVDGTVGGKGGFDILDGGIAGGGDGAEDVLLFFGWLAADDSGPGDVVVDGCFLVKAAPDVDEEEVAVFDGRAVPGGGVVVGVGGVLVDADVRAVLPGDSVGGHLVAEPFFQVVLGEFIAGVELTADFSPGFFNDAINDDAGLVVRGFLGVGEDGFELRDEVSGGEDFFADGAEVLDGAGVNHGDVDDGVVG